MDKKSKLFPKVFLYLSLSLIIIFAVGLIIRINPNLASFYLRYGNILAIFCLIFTIIFTVILGKGTLSKNNMLCLFGVQSILYGISIAYVYFRYDFYSIATVLGITAIMFLLFSCFGFVTTIDLSKFGVIGLIGLLGIIICSIVNMFLLNNTLNMIIVIVSIVIFSIYIAYDINRLKKASYYSYSKDEESKLAIWFAFSLCLDFINLFLNLLRLFGKSNN